jgi:hypothetical protein
MVYYRGLFHDLLEDREHAEEQSREAAAPRANEERVVERSAARDDDRMEIPVRRVGEPRANDLEIRNDREVRP